MKLLKFVQSDAPQTLAGADLSATRLTMRGGKGSAGPAAKTWVIAPPSAATRGGYWLLDDDNQPVGILTEVLLALPDPHTATSSSTPRGVSAGDIEGVDLRSKLGRQLERARAEYGTTYKTAAKTARHLMNADELTEKKHSRLKREREAVVEAVESGTVPDANKTSTATKRARK